MQVISQLAKRGCVQINMHHTLSHQTIVLSFLTPVRSTRGWQPSAERRAANPVEARKGPPGKWVKTRYYAARPVTGNQLSHSDSNYIQNLRLRNQLSGFSSAPADFPRESLLRKTNRATPDESKPDLEVIFVVANGKPRS